MEQWATEADTSDGATGRRRVEQLRRIGAREAMKRQPDPFNPRDETLDQYHDNFDRFLQKLGDVTREEKYYLYTTAMTSNDTLHITTKWDGLSRKERIYERARKIFTEAWLGPTTVFSMVQRMEQYVMKANTNPHLVVSYISKVNRQELQGLLTEADQLQILFKIAATNRTRSKVASRIYRLRTDQQDRRYWHGYVLSRTGCC